MQESQSSTPPTTETTEFPALTADSSASSGGVVRRVLGGRGLRVALVAAVTLAVVASALTYTSMRNSVTLAVDGEQREVVTMAGTVGEVLDEEGLDVGDRDVVAPSLDEQVGDGSEITVRFARPFDVTVDGDKQTHWVTATDVSSALGQIGSTYRDARLSTSRGASIGRDGASLRVVTSKKLTLALAGKKPVRRSMAVLTVGDALERMDVAVHKRDKVKPGPRTVLENGDKIVFTDIRVATRRDKTQAIDHGTVERENSSMLRGETKVSRQGRDGVRDVTYKVTLRNGERVKRAVTKSTVVRAPVDTVVQVGTKEPAPEPEPAPQPESSSSSSSSPSPSTPAPNYSGGSTVWDQLAACESGGNWSINTGNGYYGGLQFNLATWQGYGGSGYPHQASRSEQIRIASKVRDSRGGYGAWPSCSQSLGLPQ